MSKLLGRGSAIRAYQESNGRLDIVVENSLRETFKIRLWEGEGVSNLPDPDWLLRSFVQKGGLTVVYGPPGSGKSLIMLDWAQAIQAGEKWIGKHDTIQGNVLYVMAEGQFGLKTRLEAWKVDRNTDGLPPVKYHIEGVSFWTPQGKENEGADSIVMAAAALGIDVIFIDTMAATFGGGDENRQQDMNLWLTPLRELRQLGISVVVAHHVNRGAGELRGSTVLSGEADTLVEMKPTFNRDNPGVVDSVLVVNRKQKDFVPFTPFRMTLISVPLPPAMDGRERSGPLLVPAQDAYHGSIATDGKRLTRSGRRAQMQKAMVDAVANDPGLSWRKLRDLVSGKNTEKATVRDELLVEGILEYDEASGGYTLGGVELAPPITADDPPLLGESEEE